MQFNAAFTSLPQLVSPTRPRHRSPRSPCPECVLKLLQKKEGQRRDPNVPFGYDRLERKRVAEILTPVVQSIRQPFVLAIDGPYGTGKTTFILDWIDYLEAAGHRCAYVNAWVADFASDPLVPLLTELRSAIEKGQPRAPGSEDEKAVIRRVTELAIDVSKKAVPIAAEAAINGLGAAVGVVSGVAKAAAKVAEQIAEARIAQYGSTRLAMDEFQAAVEGLVATAAAVGSTRAPVLVFVDELDRCRPPYAVEVLERIKHLFSVRGVVFVLAVNLDQLKHSVSAMYGAGVDASGYLRRFIDLQYRLPPPSAEAYARYLFELFELERVQTLGFYHSAIGVSELCGGCASLFRFSLRQQEQHFTEVNLVARLLPPKTSVSDIAPDIDLLIVLIMLRGFDSVLYDRFVRGRFAVRAVFEALNERVDLETFLPSQCGIVMESVLTQAWGNAAAVRELRQKHSGWLERSPEPQDLQFLLAKMIDWNRTRRFGDDALRLHADLIELTAGFNLPGAE